MLPKALGPIVQRLYCDGYKIRQSEPPRHGKQIGVLLCLSPSYGLSAQCRSMIEQPPRRTQVPLASFNVFQPESFSLGFPPYIERQNMPIAGAGKHAQQDHDILLLKLTCLPCTPFGLTHMHSGHPPLAGVAVIYDAELMIECWCSLSICKLRIRIASVFKTN